MSEIASARINSLPPVAAQTDLTTISPLEEAVFILNSSQLRDIIEKAVLEAVEPLKDRLNELQATVDAQNEKIDALEAVDAFKSISSFQTLWSRMDVLANFNNKLEEKLDAFESKHQKVAGKKTEARMLKLALGLLNRKNSPITFAEVGKILELGTRDGSHNTREQNMTHFGRMLVAAPERFIVRPCRTNGGKQVSLTKIYYDHLMKEYIG
jgi:hypothetical protein